MNMLEERNRIPLNTSYRSTELERTQFVVTYKN